MWQNLAKIESQPYICGYCGGRLVSNEGYSSDDGFSYIYICHYCSNPTHIDSKKGRQYPNAPFGNPVSNLPPDVEALYNETRQCTSVQAFTASVMASRKILMNIAVEKGAEKGLSFKQYVEYLDAQHFIPPDGKDWVDHIRKKGNEANHEIEIMKKEDAEDLIIFSEMLLKFIYEFPGKMKKDEQTD